jgi:hypothetical protein
MVKLHFTSLLRAVYFFLWGGFLEVRSVPYYLENEPNKDHVIKVIFLCPYDVNMFITYICSHVLAVDVNWIPPAYSLRKQRYYFRTDIFFHLFLINCIYQSYLQGLQFFSIVPVLHYFTDGTFLLKFEQFSKNCSIHREFSIAG